MMNDTTPDAAAVVADLLRQRSGSDRVRMVSEMFDLARALAEARIRMETPDITEADLRAQLFLRFYGRDFSAEEAARLAGRLRAAGAPA